MLAILFSTLSTAGLAYQLRYFVRYWRAYIAMVGEPGVEERSRLGARNNLESQGCLCYVHGLFWLGALLWLPTSLIVRNVPPALAVVGIVLRLIFIAGVLGLIVLTYRNTRRTDRMVFLSRHLPT
jgi:hypothetical protein